jgi:hypothetical protein
MYVELQAVKTLIRLGFDPVTCFYEPSIVSHELNCMLLLGYEVTLPKCDINNTNLWDWKFVR